MLFWGGFESCNFLKTTRMEPNRMALNQQAIELNEVILQSNPHVFDLLSDRGKAIFFPKKGILQQSAEAQACSIDATIGMALEEDQSVMYLKSIAKNIALPGKDAFKYAKGPGQPQIRKSWKEMLFKKNPSLAGAAISNPMVTSALTHALSMAGYLFVNPGDKVILADLFWENYELIFKNAWYGNLQPFETFTPYGGMNLDGLREALYADPGCKKVVLLNFPNNPTGYTPTIEEVHAVCRILLDCANDGNDIVVLIDDAYFGLVFEEGIYKESIFSLLANAHERILAVKLDGPTKEDYVWGFRVGFITFGAGLNTPGLYEALESKLAGAIRGSISNAPNISQALLFAAYSCPTYESEKTEKFLTLKNRYLAVKKILADHPEYRQVYAPLPYNSGYFMCVKLNPGIDAEKVRQLLIGKYKTGVIAGDSLIRVAFSSTPVNQLSLLYENIFQAAKEIAPAG
jgi:aspartate/methionine/tyrosine aminotransferase